MATENTVKMLEAYRQQTTAPRFLSGFFSSPARNFHNTEDVEIDILREDEEVAVTVADITAGARMNEATVSTNKRFTPPVYKEAGAINAYRLMLRSAGATPYEDPNYQANAMLASMDIGRRCEEKVRRAVEWQASQVLQTGTIALTDDGGATTFAMDFSPKAAHFPNGGHGMVDRCDGDADRRPRVALRHHHHQRPRDPDGRHLWAARRTMEFMATTQVQTIADNRRYNLVFIDAPTMRGQGAVYHGTLAGGQYRLNIWTYMGRYKDPNGGAITKYVDDGKVIVLGSGRLDLTWGNIPSIGPSDPRALPFLPGRVASSANGIDLHYRSWLEKDGTGVTVQVAARPLCIPTAIDTYGCLTV